MNSSFVVSTAAAVGLSVGIAAAQAPPPAAGADQQPAYAVASPPVTSPLAAPAGRNSGAIRTALPNGAGGGAEEGVAQ